MTQAQSFQQEALKMSMQAVDGYETNYNSHVWHDTTGITKALSY